MLMKGASYSQVIDFMDNEEGKRKENPFENFSTPSPEHLTPKVFGN